METWAVVVLIIILSFVAVWLLFCIRRKTRRISHTDDLPDNCAGTRLCGVVAGISDGDGFKFFHCPWFRDRSSTSVEEGCLRVRLTGIDAPEMGSSKGPGQPFARKSKDFLSSLIQDKNIIIKVVGKDQYGRVLAVAYLPQWRWIPIWIEWDRLYTNVNLEMVKNGYACVYTGQDAKYDKYEKDLRDLEEKAKREKRGMWTLSKLQTPMEYKRIHR